MTKSVICRDETRQHDFVDQEEINVIRLAIAYSRSQTPILHVVNVSRCQELYKHIPPSRLTILDCGLSGNTPH